MNPENPPSKYHELVQRTIPVEKPQPPTPEEELDALIVSIEQRDRETAKNGGVDASDSIQALRYLTINELIPVFVELVEKYSGSGISLQMDASNFLEGGREIRFEFGLGEHRTNLMGTVTTEAIAFHETRYSPEVQGELVSGPMLRLHKLTAQVFRDFICERLTILIRGTRRR